VLIRQLSLRRFRQFKAFTWHPRPGINCLIGPGDVGKTTILEAVSRATSPAPYGPAAEHDYFRRRTDDCFEIELVLGALSCELKGAFRPPALWGWQGPDKPLRDAPIDGAEEVLRVLVRGTSDLELEHRVLSPDGNELFFSADKRRLLGLCRVGDARGSAREFRMARGSLVERTLGREDVRGAAATAVREASKTLELPSDLTDRLDDLGTLLRSDGLATYPLTLELLSPPGQSLLGLLGLALGERGEAIPLSQAGQGTQRLASFLLAHALAQTPALVVIDEIELGLEPYRRRLLIQRLRKLLEGSGQAFLTTHSSTVLSELAVNEVHRLAWNAPSAAPGAPGTGSEPADQPLPGEVPEAPSAKPQLTGLSSSLARTKDENAEALLCRFPVVCEGQTECELLRVLLDDIATVAGFSLAALGVQVVDGGGQPNVFGVIDGYCEAGFQLGMFLDNELMHSGQRQQRAARAEVSSGAWSNAICTEEAVAAALTLVELDELLEVGDPEVPRLGERRRKQLCDALGHPGELGVVELSELLDSEIGVRQGWAKAAHKSGWYKNRAHARGVSAWLQHRGLPEPMRTDVAEFWEHIAERVPVSPSMEVASPKADVTEPGA
jgi:putative ATP-dependent endonuclease of the OLD family